MKSELNYRITICFVLAAILMLSVPVLVAAQDQSPPSGMDKGASALKEKTPDFGTTGVAQSQGPLEIKKAGRGGKWTIIRLNYEISGATITKSEDDLDKANNLYYNRKVEGVVDSDQLRISGTAHVEGVEDFGSHLDVRVTEGPYDTGTALKKYEDKLDSGDGEMKFDLIVPVSRDKTYSFYIQQDCYLNYAHTLKVEGTLNPSTGTISPIPSETTSFVQPNSQDEQLPTSAPTDVLKGTQSLPKGADDDSSKQYTTPKNPESGSIGIQSKVNPSKNGKLYKILKIYQEKIPKGITNSGNKNNILSWFPNGDKYDEFKCGGYQSRVLKLLDSLKFSSNPEERALLADWDYGPIEAYWGGHQAVVIYPKGTDWVDEGIVLDPWITQSPKAYNIHSWAGIFSEGSFHGIGGSSVYEGTPEYPTVGGSYVDPKNKKRSQEEIDFLKKLSPEKKKIYEKMTEDQKGAWVKVKMAEQNKGGRAMGFSPLNIYVTNDMGKISGFPKGVPTLGIPEVSVRRIPLSDGTYWTELEYPLDGSYNLNIEGTNEGEADVFTGFGFDDISQRSVYKYNMKVSSGQKLEVPTSSKGKSLLSSSKSVASEEIQEINPNWLDSKPEIVAPSEYEVDAQGYTDSGTSSEPSEGTSSVIPEGENKVIFNNWNTGGVDNSPSCAPSFTLSEPHMITYIDTYHWNYGSGTKAGGNVILRDHDGKEYGPWQVETKSGQGGVPNAWWIAHPNEVIPAGTYGVVDSEQSTWSQNPESGGCGFSKVEGYPVKDMSKQQQQPAEVTGESKTISTGGQKEVGDSGLVATKDNPEEAEGWYTKGYNLARLGKYDEAINAYDEAIRLDPKYVNAWYAKGNNLNNLGRYDEAINAYDGAIRLDPKYENAWYAKGVDLKKQERYDEAINAYGEAIRLDPKYAKAWYAKGNALKLLGRTTEADAAYAKAKELGYTD